MIDWSSYLTSKIMVTTRHNVHYYERYVNLAQVAPTPAIFTECAGLITSVITVLAPPAQEGTNH